MISSILTGVAGEYFVAAELSRRGYVASITLRNTRGIDIIASNADATKSVAIQVKTNQRSQAEWLLSSKIETQEPADNLFFVFVKLNGAGSPDYHVVPCAEVVKYAAEGHVEWLNTPGRNGQPHNDNSMRKFRDPNNQYLNGWDRLGLG